MDFIMLIFILLYVACPVLGSTVYRCSMDAESQKYYKCLSNWRLLKQHQSNWSAYLNYPIITDEICGGGYSIDKMDKCVTDSLSPQCDNILAFWNSTKTKFTFICKHRTDFIMHHQCRENDNFLKDFNQCVADNYQRIQSNVYPVDYRRNFCSSYKGLKRCLTNSLKRYCTNDARQFFSNLFDAENSPVMTYMQCYQYEPKVKSLDDNTAETQHSVASSPSTNDKNVPDADDSKMDNTVLGHKSIVGIDLAVEKNICTSIKPGLLTIILCGLVLILFRRINR